MDGMDSMDVHESHAVHVVPSQGLEKTPAKVPSFGKICVKCSGAWKAER